MVLKKITSLLISFVLSFLFIFAIHGFFEGDFNQSLAQTFPSQRDVYQWPFSRYSIWNMPIGSNAKYTPQPINPEHIGGVMTEQNIIVMTPNEDFINVYGTEYLWQRETNSETRCRRKNSTVHLRLPIPKDYITNFSQIRPNNPGAILRANGRTLVQTLPFQVCPDGYGTTGLRSPDGVISNQIFQTADQDIYGDGLHGSQGGSGMSALGGAIRVGELAPGSEPIRHALKISFPGEHYLYYDDRNDIGYRWPAHRHDRNAKERYNGSESEALIGCLRAIPPWVNLNALGLETEPARKIAWTLQNYGAYQVEEVPWNRMMIATEEGPAGNVVNKFKQDWGYDLITEDPETNPFLRDMVKLMPYFHIVSNNAPDNIGGGGAPRQPLAPPFVQSGETPQTLETASQGSTLNNPGNIIPTNQLSENTGGGSRDNALRIEAETIATLPNSTVSGYRFENGNDASGNTMLSLIGGKTDETGTVILAIDDLAELNSGQAYRIRLGTFDESDGQAVFRLNLNGSKIGQVTLNSQFGSDFADRNTRVALEMSANVTLQSGDILTVLGNENLGEHARFDFIEFVPVGLQ